MVAAIAGVATVAGAAISSSAAGDAADAQAEGTQQSNALQRYMYDNNVALQQPTIQAGNLARNSLLYQLGLSPTGTSGGGSSSTQPLTYDQLKEQLRGQYTRTGQAAGAPAFDRNQLGQMDAAMYDRIQDPQERAAFEAAHLGSPSSVYDGSNANTGTQGDRQAWQQAGTATSTIDEQGLDAAIRGRLAEQEAAQRSAEEAARNDPNYGRLAQQFQFNTYTPDTYKAPDPYVADKFSYTGEDLYNDPSYQFRLDQGQKALDRKGAASGRYLSGAQLQATSDYNQGAASQEFQNAYQRALGTFGTNEGNRAQAYNTNTTNGLNAFNVNSTNKYNAFNTNETNRFNANQANFSNAINPLLSLAGSGQTSAQFLGGAGQQTAQIMGNNLTNQANATGAAGIASANQISSGINGAVNGYQQNQLLNNLLNRSGGVNNNPGYPTGYNGGGNVNYAGDNAGYQG